MGDDDGVIQRVHKHDHSVLVGLDDQKEKWKEMDGKRHLNVAFFGHTWSGKSTIVGHIVSMTNQIDAETVKKYETVAKDKRLGSWFTAYGMDTNKDWQRKGKVGVGRAHLETESSRYTILDVPGHDCLNMIKDIEEDVGKVDIGVLVVCALKDPCDIWEYAFKKNGEKWTREHITFAKELHVSKLFVVINQMDSPSVNWSQQRYDDMVSRMREIIKPLRSNGNRVQYLPLSGINGSNMKEQVDDAVCSWWHGPTLFESFDSTEFWWTSCAAPFRMPICKREFETNTTAAAYIGYVESGSVRIGDTLILMPQQVPVAVDAIFINPYLGDGRVERARYGEYIMLNLSGIEVEAVTAGDEVACVACEHEVTDYEGTDDDSDTQVELADDKIMHCKHDHSVLVGLDDQKEKWKEMDGKRHLNVAFFGHTWSGKSTIVGHIVSMTNQIDAETVKKYETVAKDNKRLGSWFTAYGMDTNKDWRRKGKVGVGRAHLETESSRYTILDVPGHDCYDCLNMIKDIEEDVGKVDIGVLVVCALKDPCDIWEYAFKKNGEKWTRDHITFAKELHVSKLFVVINQMDRPSVNWSQQRYDDTVSRMREIIKPLRSYGNRVQYLPLSGINGSNMNEPVDDAVCPWWHGPTLFESFDSTEFWWTSCAAPFRMPICKRAFETNTTAAAYIGYVESGSVRVGDTLILMPQQVPVSVDAIFINPDWRDRMVERARYGEYIMLNLSGIEVEAVTDGEEVACVACEHEETDYEGTDDDSDTQVEVADDKINTEKVEVADNEVNTEEVEDLGLELLELVCMFCEAGPFPTYDALEVHQNSHSYVECDVCGRRFRNSLYLDLHMYRCHEW